LEPLSGLLDGLFAGHLDAGLEIGAGLHVDGKLPRQFEINGIEPAGRIPLRGKILYGCCRSHDFTIQLGTSPRKRAATTVLPGWYCNATTQAPTSNEPSEFFKRRSSPNSSGVLQAK